ncbi:hypothetical protein GTO91_07375 [Heliobacterium undosum]|uniref:Copper amine oxidase-like N-terminal domain-containing protein n=1 Tax=Heliomicrobium undosum TaxID=121734 RepID=A0A845L1M5_9FIRM|nr:copper amine oxidase N-terminal domain-containing protein [Heliomicrobium undosum]MZP29526.1 hypothetical protein [Heliomicrobium undosum]
MFPQMKKTVVSLISVIFLAAMLLPNVALASSTYMPTQQAVSAPGSTFSARVMIEVPYGAAVGGQQYELRLRLPSNTQVGAITYDIPPSYDNGIGNQLANTAGGFTNGNATSQPSPGTPEFVINVQGTGNTGKGLLYVNFTNITVPSGQNGNFKAVFEARPGSIFSNGEVIIASVGSGSLTASIDDVRSFSSSGLAAIDPIRIKEDRPGALKSGTDTIKLKLPAGFTWSNVPAAGTPISQIWSDANTVITYQGTTDSGRTLQIGVAFNNGATQSNSAVYFSLNGIGVSVDESTARTGDVTVDIGGRSSCTPGSLVIGSYGEYGAHIKTYGDTPTLLAGRKDAIAGKFVIEEDLVGSLVANRTITLTLPDNVRWHTTNIPNPGNPTVSGISLSSADSDANNLALTNGNGWEIIDSERRIAKATVNQPSTGNKRGKLVFEKAELEIAPGFSGDIKVEVSGSAGLSGAFTIGKAVLPVSMSANSAPEVKIGLDNQAAADVTVTENYKEALMSKNDSVQISNVNTSVTFNELRLYLPAGVDFTTTPKFEVVEGDLVLMGDSATTATDATERANYAVVKIKSTSSTPSRIKISNIKLRVDRTVPEGDIVLKIKGNGTATSEMVVNADIQKPFASSTVTSAVIARVNTPAPGEQKTSASFKVNSARYSVNGVEKTMDQAPYIKEGRVFVPVRYVAESLGIDHMNVIWDGEKQTATLIKGDKVLQIAIGSRTQLINGVSITMDVAPELTDAGRVMLPVRWIAERFGATPTWDDASQTVGLK